MNSKTPPAVAGVVLDSAAMGNTPKRTIAVLNTAHNTSIDTASARYRIGVPC